MESGRFPGRSQRVFLDINNTKQFLAPMAEVEHHGEGLTHAATGDGPLCAASPVCQAFGLQLPLQLLLAKSKHP